MKHAIKYGIIILAGILLGFIIPTDWFHPYESNRGNILIWIGILSVVLIIGACVRNKIKYGKWLQSSLIEDAEDEDMDNKENIR